MRASFALTKKLWILFVHRRPVHDLSWLDADISWFEATTVPCGRWSQHSMPHGGRRSLAWPEATRFSVSHFPPNGGKNGHTRQSAAPPCTF